jgi:integrase
MENMIFMKLIDKYIYFCNASKRPESTKLHANVFLRWCQKRFSGAEYLTQEMVNQWWVKSDTETNVTHLSRIYKALPFLRYTNEVLRLTNVSLPPLPPFVKSNSLPHYFTHQELTSFFKACNELQTNNSNSRKLRKLIVPVIFRLLYSTGLRVLEARMLLREDVDFETGVLNVKRTKGYFEHRVVLHDTMLTLLKEYDFAADKLLPNRRVLFPNENDEYHKNKRLSDQFFVCWYKYNTPIAFARELRHQYAIENINSWTNEEYDTCNKLVALKNSMGHTKLSRTLYYYSMVPAYGGLIEDRCGESFSKLIPKFDTYEE